MKNRLKFCFLFWCVSLICGGAGELVSSSNSEHVLLENGEVRCQIVIPDEAGPVAAFAGKELQEFLSRSFRGEVVINPAPVGEYTAIILGQNHFASIAGVDFEVLERDEFVIKSFEGNIIIAGRDDMNINPESQMHIIANQFDKGGLQYERGTLFGVYEFLERFLGVRFYFPGDVGTVVPRHEKLALPVLDVACRPDFTVRQIGPSGIVPDGGTEYDRINKSFKHLNNLRLRMQTQYIPNCHGLGRLEFIERFGESHPEYFALMNDGRRDNDPTRKHSGHLCFSSGIRDEIYKDAEAFLTMLAADSAKLRNVKPYGVYQWRRGSFQPGYFNIQPEDGFYPCNCEKCQVYFKGTSYTSLDQESTSEFIWELVCDVAEKLQSNNIPGYVTAMAYSPYKHVPKRDIPDNVIVMVAVNGPWGNPDNWLNQNEFVSAWHEKLGRKVWLWNYVGKFYGSQPGIPCSTPRAVGQYYALMSPHIFGAFMTSSTDYFIFQYLNYYVYSKVAWNNDVDVEAVLREHHQKMFGEAASVMAEIYDIFESKWMLDIRGNVIDTDLGPVAAPPPDRYLWGVIYSDAEIARINSLFDESEQLTAASPGHYKRVKFIREHMFAPLVQAQAQYANRIREIADLSFYAQTIPADQIVEIDGVLDDRVWGECGKIFLRNFPADDNATASVRTTVRILRDADNLYIAFECDEPDMSEIVAVTRENGDSGIFKDSSVEIFLNPSGDLVNYRQLAVNALGAFVDIAGEKIGASQNLDWNWFSGATVAARMHDDFWVTEVKIPLQNLGELDADGFPVNFVRNRIVAHTPTERFTWSPFLKRGFHEIENFGSLRFVPVPDVNLLKDSDFSVPPDDDGFGGVGAWRASPESNWEIDENYFVRGGKSLLLKGNTSGNVAIKQHIPELKPDTEYLLTYFIRTENVVADQLVLAEGGISGAYITIWDKSGLRHNFPFKSSYVGTTPWSKEGFAFKTGKADEQQPSFIILAIRCAGGMVWFDDVRVRENM